MAVVDFTAVDPAELAISGELVNIVPVGADEKLAILVWDDTGVKVMGLLDTVAIGVVAARMVCLGGVDVTSVACGVVGDLIKTLILGFFAETGSGWNKEYKMLEFIFIRFFLGCLESHHSKF